MYSLTTAKSATEFLISCLEKDIESNVFSETDGYIRGVADGKAEEANNIINLIRSLSYDQ